MFEIFSDARIERIVRSVLLLGHQSFLKQTVHFAEAVALVNRG